MESILYFLDSTKEFFIENGAWGLFILSFTEASFFPIPPDVVLLPLALFSPGKALYYAAITSIASSLGGIFGYFIGVRAGRPILSRFIREENFYKIEDMFSRYGGWAIAVAGFTPIPYKVFTIASGVFHMNLATFIIATILSRSARFFLEGAIILVMGDNAMVYINKLLGPGSFLVLAIVGVLYYIVRRSGLSVSFKLTKGTFAYKVKHKVSKLLALYGEFGIYLVAGFSIAATFGFMFFKLAADVFEKEMEWFDKGIISYLERLNPRLLDNISFLFIKMQSPIVFFITIILCLLLVYFFYKNNIYSVMSLSAFAGSFLLQWGFKSFYKRPRISIGSNLTDFFSYSFPSGFIVLYTALFGYVAFLLLRSKNKFRKITILTLWICLMLIVSISRVYAGISYPSDVLAGFLLGGLWLAICIVATKAFEYYR
ncbi:MAG: VTT domain-containing protein [Tepidanaerobacteraceae bacterium]|jgi:membrane protein YqaA with SNARE-associated domain/membrane-associated phospholipid phosphatase